MMMPISWQLIFFGGLVIGFHWPEITNWWRKFSPQVRTRVGISLAMLTVLTVGLSAALVYSEKFGFEFASQLENWHKTYEFYHFDKSRLPVARLILGTIWFWGLFWVVRHYEKFFIKYLGKLLIPFGINSLYVYIVQAFIVFFMHLFIWKPQVDDPNIALLPINLGLSILATWFTWLLVKHRVLFNIIPR